MSNINQAIKLISDSLNSLANSTSNVLKRVKILEKKVNKIEDALNKQLKSKDEKH